MGRKPNPVVAKYFTRGAKIGDASNRYQFTCKQCGERFPKGRIESLHNHITKKCTALSLQAKLGLAADAARSMRNKPKVHKGKKAGLPLSSQRQHNSNGLNVLAEASCQLVATRHSCSTSHTSPATIGAGVDVPPSVLDSAPENETFSSGLIRNGETDRRNHENGMSSRASSSNDVVSSALTFLPNSTHDSRIAISSCADDLSSYITSAVSPATLASVAAASADTTLDHKTGPDAPGPMADNGPLSFTSHVATTANRKPYSRLLPAVNRICDGVQNKKLPKEQMTAKSPRPIAIDPHTTFSVLSLEFSRGSPNRQSEICGEDAEARKQDIQKMRKLGSCIRCRMLRKPCSETTPCVTCRAIDSPRSWKGFRCLRAKLVDLSQGHMLGLHQKLFNQDINAAKSAMGFVPFHGKLLVKYFQAGDTLILRALRNNIYDCAAGAIDPSLSKLPIGWTSTAQTLILDNEADDLPTILEEYIRKHVAYFFKQESSPIVKSAAVLAYELSQDSEDVLLKNAVELWMLTTMLSDPTTRWKVAIPQILPRGSFGYHPGGAAAGSRVDEHTNQQAEALICSELQSGVERVLTKLSTYVFHKFERRLMRPASLNHFETFLLAVIIINCIERHSWIFHSWIDEAKADSWPLDHSPAVLLSQAEQTAAVIAFMTRIRNLAPKITEDTAAGVLKAEHPNSKKYAKWFEERSIAVDLPAQRQDAAFDAKNFRSLDLKYSATLLLPSHNT